jgi:molybdenum cofactor synthesis domain-containing protein
MEPATSASCVVVGNEILSGKVRDSNSHHLALWLRARGVDLQRIQVIPDVVDTIAQVVAEESRRSSMVFTSGGVGPTHDDLTYRGVAAAFGLSIRRHADLQARIQAFYKGQDSEVRLRMADLPHPCLLHDTPGLWVPVVQVHNVYVLPGIPLLFERMLGQLDSLVKGVPITLCSVDTQQREEDLALILEALLTEFPGLEIGSYPRVQDPDHRVRLTLESRNPQQCFDATRALVARLDAQHLVRVTGLP